MLSSSCVDRDGGKERERERERERETARKGEKEAKIIYKRRISEPNYKRLNPIYTHNNKLH